MFSLASDYVVSLMLGWPGALLGVLLLIHLIEQSLERRLFVSTRIKVILAAVILILGAITVHPKLSAPGDAAIQRAQALREQHARDAAAHDAQERRQHDGDSDERLKSEVDSLRKELETERPRQR
jgi:ABC-type transport system involved in cytochrome bd biosynthesis fused ATPase/permease subunit